MMNRQQLELIEKAVDDMLSSLGDENERWMSESAFPESQQEVIAAAMTDFEKALMDYWDEQQRALLKLLDESALFKSEDGGIAETIFNFFFGKDMIYLTRLEELYEAYASPLLSKIAQITCAELIKKPKTKSLSQRAREWLKGHKIAFAKEVNQHTHDRVINILDKAMRTGAGPNVVANKLLSPKYRADYRDKTKQKVLDMPEFDWRRAQTTARTEMTAAANAGTLEGWRQSEVVHHKEWMCAGGSRTRDTHKHANGQVVHIDEPFKVGEYELMHPADGSLGAGPEEVCNCRCTMKSVTDAMYEARKEVNA